MPATGELVGLPAHLLSFFLFVPGFYPCLTTLRANSFSWSLKGTECQILDKSVSPKTQITVESVCEQTDWGATEIRRPWALSWGIE